RVGRRWNLRRRRGPAAGDGRQHERGERETSGDGAGHVGSSCAARRPGGLEASSSGSQREPLEAAMEGVSGLARRRAGLPWASLRALPCSSASAGRQPVRAPAFVISIAIGLVVGACGSLGGTGSTGTPSSAAVPTGGAVPAGFPLIGAWTTT